MYKIFKGFFVIILFILFDTALTNKAFAAWERSNQSNYIEFTMQKSDAPDGVVKIILSFNMRENSFVEVMRTPLKLAIGFGNPEALDEEILQVGCGVSDTEDSIKNNLSTLGNLPPEIIDLILANQAEAKRNLPPANTSPADGSMQPQPAARLAPPSLLSRIFQFVFRIKPKL